MPDHKAECQALRDRVHALGPVQGLEYIRKLGRETTAFLRANPMHKVDREGLKIWRNHFVLWQAIEEVQVDAERMVLSINQQGE